MIDGLYANQYWLSVHYPNIEKELSPKPDEKEHEVLIRPGFAKIVREGDTERERRVKEINAEYSKALHERIDQVTSKRCFGPRGDYYEWCALKGNGLLDFGQEEGNYAGGHTLSPLFYPLEDYRRKAQIKLACINKEDPEFYQAIMEMLARHHCEQ